MVIPYPRIKPIFIKENGLYSGTEPVKYVGMLLEKNINTTSTFIN